MEEERIWHFIKPQGSQRMPRRHIFMDSEAFSDRTDTGHRQTWRLAAAHYHRQEKNRAAIDDLRTYRDPRTLWTDVSAFTRARNRTILWCHNLGYDVRITNTFGALPSLGWRLVGHNLANRGTWLHWTRDGTSLLMVDSASVFPIPLAQLAKSFLRPKLPLPDNGASADDWMARCVRDVEILRDAVLAYLHWIEAEGLGSWQLTGAGQSYAAFRSRFLSHGMMVHADQAALEAERRAMWAGRCEAYFRGRTGQVGVQEWDFSLDYARLARDNAVPVHLIGEVPPDGDLRTLLTQPGRAYLARVEVETSIPTVPCEVDGRIAWPVGKFETTLWGPELALALAYGARINVRQLWLYRTAPALKEWAEWVIAGLDASNTQTTEWQRVILKHWARALIGRFGMSYTKWVEFGRTTHQRVAHSTVYDTATGHEYSLTHLGHDVMAEGGQQEWDQSQPAITGYIMSLSRAKLFRVVQSLPPNSVLYVDTDSFYIPAAYHDQAARLAQTPLGAGLRLKHTYKRATILGPRQVIVEGRPRIAGVPRDAQTLASGAIQGEVWDSLVSSLRRGESSSVRLTQRTWRVTGKDHRRVGGPQGWTEPLTV